MRSSRCKLGALCLSYTLGCPSALSSTLTLLRLISSHRLMPFVLDSSWYFLLEEGDGRCVRASWPYSTKHSILSLLLNPPLTFDFT